ncbi:hypothetical protein [Nitrosomonas supralitoralis]|uniref:hypothetical protein n=1 Tax=Nitrosomonas supralitoralis TaxID=2116706 RepID=UPI00403EA696
MSSIPASVMTADQNDLIQYRSGDSFYRTVILLYDSFVCRSSMLATLSLLYVSTAARGVGPALSTARYKYIHCSLTLMYVSSMRQFAPTECLHYRKA